MKPLIPYLRQSIKKSEETISIEEQLRENVRWAKANNIPLAEPIIEQNVSGNKSWRARELGRAIARCAPGGDAQGIIVAYQSRLSRQSGLHTAEVWEELQRIGARLVCVKENIDTATGDHEFIFQIHAAIARKEWRDRQQGWLDARRNAIERGVHTGKVPFGYLRDQKTRKLVKDPETWKLVREMFKLRANGASQSDLKKYLAGCGYPLAKGTIQDMLRCKTYLGIAACGDFINEQAHPAIVNQDLWDRANVAKGLRPVVRGDIPAMLKSIARCDGCGSALIVQRASVKQGGTSRYYYVCRGESANGCPSKANISGRKLDALVDEFIIGMLEERDTDLEAHAANERLEEAEAGVADAERKLERIRNDTDLYDEDPDTYKTLKNAAQAKVEMLRIERANAANASATLNGFIGSVREAWPTLAVDTKREFLGQFLGEIRVRRGRGNFEERFSVIDRDGVLLNHTEYIEKAAVRAQEPF